jgi:hypothetical protein
MAVIYGYRSRASQIFLASNINSSTKFVRGDIILFSFTSSTQQFLYNNSKSVKTELYGANAGYQQGSNTLGGYGGYTSVSFDPRAYVNIYLIVGGRGGRSEQSYYDGNCGQSSTGLGGYNGGGRAGGSSSSGGGGATDIRTSVVDPIYNSNSYNTRLAVAGGGGGGGYNYQTGSYSAGNAYSNNNIPASMCINGVIYQGRDGYYGSVGDYCGDNGGGGGGYYGGGSTCDDDAAPTQGGSSYVDAALTNISVQAGINTPTSTFYGTSTNGDGLAIVTILSI